MVAVLASTGVVLAAAYMLWLYKRVVFGDLNESLKNLADLNKQEIFVFVSLASLIIFFGFYPDPLLKTISPTIDNIIYNYEQNLIYHLNDSAFWKSTTEGNN